MSLFSSLKPKAKLSRDVFDLSHTDSFSMKTGVLTPVFVQHTIPDAHYKVDLSNIVRVDEMKQANFVGVSQNIEFAFVPYSQIWKDFNRFYYERGEQTRTPAYGQSQQIPNYVPTFGLKAIITQLVRGAVAYIMYKKLLDLWNDNDFTFATLTLQDIEEFGYFYGVAPKLGTNWYDLQHVDIHGNCCVFEQIRNLDMLGYGNYWPEIKTYLNFVDPLIVIPSDATLDSLKTLYTTILGTFTGTAAPVDFSAQFPDVAPNSFAIFAYAKFFNDVYKNREYDTTPYHQWYNCDWFRGITSSQRIPELVILQALKPNYKQYKKDLFTGLYPNPQFGDVAVASFSHDTNIFNVKTLTAQTQQTYQTRVQGVLTSVPGQLTVLDDPESNVWRMDSKISALAIRQAEALQRYKERIVRAGNREKDLQEAVFGVGSRYIQDEYVDFLGSFQGVLQNNPVAATADTDNAVVGQLGSYSVGSISLGSNREINFDSKDFGIIIGVMYILPETKYEAMGISPHNTKFEKTDFYNPAFQNLGLQPVYNYTACNVGSNFAPFVGGVLGYLARYYEYKTEVSKVHGEFFASTPNFVFGNSAYPILWQSRSGNVARFGAFSDYVAPRDVNQFTYAVPNAFYVSPRDLDSVFYVSYDPLPAFDHFKVEMNFQVKAVLPMSTTGLPSY